MIPNSLRTRASFSRIIVLAALLLPLGTASRLSAQTFPATEWGPRIMSRMLYNAVLDTLAASRPGASRPAGVVPASGGPVSMVFEPSLDRRRENIARRIAQMRTVDADGAEWLRAVTATGDTLAAYALRVKPAGINPNSVADAFAAWVTIMWQELHPPATSLGALLRTRAQAERALRDIPAFAAASDAEKQEFAEALTLNIIANAARMRDARGNADKQKVLFATLQRAGSELRVDFEHMTETTQGFLSSDMVKPAPKP